VTLNVRLLVLRLLLCVELLSFSLLLSLGAIQAFRYGVITRLHAHQVAKLALILRREQVLQLHCVFLADELFQVEFAVDDIVVRASL